ncbi:protocadherin-11 X-linked-like [Babylonia areolata]|uniref:protocadherin-11 X-linked-like n=1 Tax=Babylonia areolata TaxID=304850 RepID=UPI003FCFCF7A
MESVKNQRGGMGFTSRGVCVFWVGAAVLWLCLSAISPVQGQGQEEILSYKIQEESDVGAFVGNVARDSQLYSRFTQDEFQQLQYSISSRTSKFSIDENTSTIRTGQVLDREVECQFNSPSQPCELGFDVGVYRWDDSKEIYDLLMIVHITVVLEDINDNSPQFPKDVVYLSVPESAPVGHVLLTSGAVDRDTGAQNTIKQYRLVPDHGAFRLQVMTSVDGISSDLGIVVEQPLDREQQSTYRMQVVATDGGFPQRSGSVNITINVQDINDNAPAFSRDVFNITVKEDAPTGMPILRLVATDPDSSHNGALSFGFSSRTSQKILSQFAVDPNSGDVILTRPLDFEKDQRLQFMVVVKDHGSPEQQTQAAVIVNVADVNDNAPQIDITLPPGGTVKAESVEVGSFIAHVSLSDLDGGKNGEIECSLTNDHFRLEKFSDYSYIFKILLQRSLDYEDARQQQVNVTCSDQGNPPLHNSSSFTIHVRDENDNAPIFSKPEYHISVRENIDPGLFVFEVIAMDPDSNNNGNISYILLENPDSAFSIDSVSGRLRAMKKFDRETRSSYVLVIQARDRGIPPMSSTAVVHVEIDDVNDSPTRFAQSHFEFYIEEEQPKGAVVDSLHVVDLDNVPSQQLQFSFFQEYSSPAEFHIDVKTGQITTTRPLDREAGHSVFDFKVFVVDAENVMFNDTASVTVKVTDVNDHAPNITFPSEGNHTVRLPNTIPAGTIITKVQAYDLDRGENGTSGMTYGLESGDVRDIFLMNGINGELILTRRLDSRDVGTYHLRVSVQDSGRVVQKTAVASLDVVIGSSNSSGGGLFSPGGQSDHNVAIVITLVCVTLALALAVLATICIIRRIDRERKHHTSTKAEEQNIYKQETLPPPASVEEKTPTMENYENEIEKLKRKIKRELSFVTDEDMMMDSSGSNGTTTASFSTFKKTSPCSTIDPKMLSSPQASSSILHSSTTSPDHTLSSGSGSTGGGIKRVHYLDRARDLNRVAGGGGGGGGDRDNSRPSSPAMSPTSGASSSSSWGQQHSRSAGLSVRPEGEDTGSHTSGSTSDSGRGASSEDDGHCAGGGGGVGSESGDDLRLHNTRAYLTNPGLSTFRLGPSSSSSLHRPDRYQQQQHHRHHDTNHHHHNDNSATNTSSSSSSPHHHHYNSSTSLNSQLTSASPRSYLQAQGGGGPSNHHGYSRNISFSDDSVTANTTVDGGSGHYDPKKSSPPQQERRDGVGKEESSGGGGGGSLRSILSKDIGSRYGRMPGSRGSSKAQGVGSTNRSGDDLYGVRGKVVSFSLAGDSYQMTPRRAGSSTRLAPTPEASGMSSGVEEVGGGGGGGNSHSHLYANQTGHSSLGQPYSLADMDDVLNDSNASRVGGVGAGGAARLIPSEARDPGPVGMQAAYCGCMKRDNTGMLARGHNSTTTRLQLYNSQI